MFYIFFSFICSAGNNPNSKLKIARSGLASTSSQLNVEEISEGSDDEGACSQISEVRIEAKGIAIRDKVVATLSKLLYEANVDNRVSPKQVDLKWHIREGKPVFDIKAFCPLCGVSLAVPMVKDTICGMNFQRHLKRKHAQGKDPAKPQQKQAKLSSFFLSSSQSDSLIVSDDEGGASTSSAATEPSSIGE